MALNAVLDVLIRRRQKEMLLCPKRRKLTRKAETGVMWPQAKGGLAATRCWRARTGFSPRTSRGNVALPKTLISVQSYRFWTSGLQN